MQKQITQTIANELNINESQVKSTVALIDDGNTIPFIARYRKEATGGLSDETLRNLYDRLTYLRNLEERKAEVSRLIEEQGKLTEELQKAIENAITLAEIEDIYRPYKQKKRTRATIAKEKGLEPLATIIYEQTETTPLNKIAEQFLNPEKEVNTVEEAIAGALDIIAENISDEARFRKNIKSMCFREAVIWAKAAKEEKSVYEMYYDYSEAILRMPSHRILAINRGEKEEFLKVKLEKPEEKIIEMIENYIIKKDNNQFTNILKDTILDSYKRLIEPSIEREIRADLTEKAEEKAIKVFGQNAKQLLLQPPMKNVRVIGFDPAYRTGCKIAVIDETGKVLDTNTIYPTEPQNDVIGAKKTLLGLINKHKVNIIAIGNGTASRESEQFVSEVLKECKEKVYYAIVSEAGASVYSASKLATEEYPDINVSIRGAISIARRLQDPLAELVKIDPKAIGVGQYQHDVNQKTLSESLTGVVEDAVNSVGVDVNTATPSLLTYVAGINSGIAKNIVMYRDENGKFTERKQLLKVAKLGKSAFEQCAGFTRIFGGKNLLEMTAVHPESYKATEQLLSKLGYTVKDLEDKEKFEQLKGSLKNLLPVGASIARPNVTNSGVTNSGMTNPDEQCSPLQETAEELGIGEMTLSDIINELLKPGRDPRESSPKPILRADILKFEDLREGMVLNGTVRNVIDFGAFVDIGVKNDGLVHISELADKYVKSPSEIVSVGDVVKVKVIGLDMDRHKVKLSMKNV
ncbi:MAG: RNA-binding transcriptional accessory protein [Oscillospiraceae bacterium]|nr:RNA-binding transcriptional accessory protein [Oscillospiraceae bacterium]